MMSKRVFCPLRSIGLSAVLLALVSGLHAQTAGEAISIGNDDIGGVVNSTKGPEGGVWVIAETTDFPTKLLTIGAATSCRSFPRRTTKYGCAATGSWIPSQSRGLPEESLT